MILHQFLVVMVNLQCEPQGSGNSIAGHLYFADIIGANVLQLAFMVILMVQSIVLMVLHQFLVVMVNLHMDIEALATPLQDIFDLLILLMPSIFHGKFDGAIDSSDAPAASLGGIGESEYGHMTSWIC